MRTIRSTAPLPVLALAIALSGGCAGAAPAGSPLAAAGGVGAPATSQTEPAMSEDHMEAILLWSSGGPAPAAERWLADQGFQTMPMRAGLLVAGDREAFERAFGVPLAGRELPVTLPVPPPLQDAVAGISLRRPPDYHRGG